MHTGDASVTGITGSPGTGKSTLVGKLVKYYRDQGGTVGVIAADPSSPYTGGTILGDCIHTASNADDMDAFFRLMSARGQFGGLLTTTVGAVKALDALGKDRVIIKVVGAGQGEVDMVKTAGTAVVLIQPDSGDNMQMFKTGTLEVGDVFVVNKADMEGASRTITELQEMIHLRDDPQTNLDMDYHGAAALNGGHGDGHGGHVDASDIESDAESGPSNTGEPLIWTPQVLEMVAMTGEGIDELIETLDDHRDYLDAFGGLTEKARKCTSEETQQCLRSDVSRFLEAELGRRGGVEEFVRAVAEKEADPYTVAEGVLEPPREYLNDRTD